MDSKHNKSIVPNAKELRKNMTKEERHLWYDFLRNHSARFSRQKVLGKYIVDFYSAQAQMVIELDGSQHFEEAGQEYDKKRDEYIKGYGLKIIRIPNNEVNENFDGVCAYLDSEITQSLSQLLQKPSLLSPAVTFPHTVGNLPLHKGAFFVAIHNRYTH